MKKILVTGGAGYIGSHTSIELINQGYDVVIIDNFVNSTPTSIDRVETVTGVKPLSIELDLCNMKALSSVFEEHEFDAVIHFAGLKAVGESVQEPMSYYTNNLISTLNLIGCMSRKSVNKLIFSSSATVYGVPDSLPIYEEFPLEATSPYGRTKLFIEQILRDCTNADTSLSISILRYFNPVGAHESGLLGEDPNGIPNNLLPYVAQVAVGRQDKVRIFGDNYATIDGTGVRDYIHITDLARGHVAALRHMPPAGACEAYNLGTGKGSSVLEVIKAFEHACGKNIPYEVVARRAGDIASCYASSEKAEQKLFWRAEKTLEEACVDTWNWQSKNPNGFKAV